jgi:hypothetical protein
MRVKNKLQMKYLIYLVIITLSINCYGETNREILEDIREELEFMQYERQLQNASGDRNYDNLNRSNQNISPQNPPTKQPQPYRNTESEADRLRLSKFWNLNMSEYLRRDEIGSVTCERYLGAVGNIYRNCFQSKMLNISYTETEMRWNKLMSTCSKIPSGTPNKEQCIKNILVYGK